jgi:hypothetical protein
MTFLDAFFSVAVIFIAIVAGALAVDWLTED